MTPDLERYDPPGYVERLEAENAELRSVSALYAEARQALDEFDHYASVDLDYAGSPFAEKVRAVLAR